MAIVLPTCVQPKPLKLFCAVAAPGRAKSSSIATASAGKVFPCCHVFIESPLILLKLTFPIWFLVHDPVILCLLQRFASSFLVRLGFFSGTGGVLMFFLARKPIFSRMQRHLFRGFHCFHA